MPPHIVYVDTETTGLPPRGRSNPKDSVEWEVCRMVQLAWSVVAVDPSIAPTDPATAMVHSYIVRPDGWTIPAAAAAIHGIDDARALAEGKPIREVLQEFLGAVALADYFVAHNADFDRNVVLSEFYRAGLEDDADIIGCMGWQCTMRMGTPRGARWVKLGTLYERLLGHPMPWPAHQADNDVRACMAVHQALQLQAAPACP